ncbi:hypothetical protein D3C87_1712050 [compost metagenome]
MRSHKPASRDQLSHLFKFDQGALKIFGMQKEHRLAMGTDLRLAVAENACAGRLQRDARSKDILDLVADVMHAAGRIFGEESGNRRGVTKRFQQFDLGVG